MDVKNEILSYFESQLTDRRRELVKKVLLERTRHVTLVLENIYQTQNANAVLRTAECLGIQDIHIIENSNKYDINPQVLRGANKWLDLHYYNQNEFNTPDCIQQLKLKGYKVIATTPSEDAKFLPELDLSQKVAIMFGTEKQGLTSEALSMADETLKIPMVGFTESLNISVSAALVMYDLTQRLRKSDIKWQLSKEEFEFLYYEWMKKATTNSESIEREFIKRRGNLDSLS